jgi:ABC-type multidrug transport system ATPase subunit
VGAVQSAAEKVQLDGNPFNMPASTLSGGQRRRLSIAISLLGDPDIVFLDEPTTGLDPENRNSIHRILAAEKRPGRTLLLTTHSMDEADILCDRIAILGSGRLRAVGSQQRLKHRFGAGYKLTLHLLAPPAAAAAGGLPASASSALLEATAAAAHAFVLASVAPSARLVNRVGTTLSYSLPREGLDVSAVFGTLDAARGKRATGIAEFGLEQSSLEEVFVSVVEASEKK